MINKSTLLVVVSAFFFFACSDGGGSSGGGLPAEMGAKRIGEKAKALSKAHKHLEAAKLYDELVEKYSDTKYFAELKQELFNKGISIEKTLSSITSKRMFKFQNMLIRYKKKHGYYPQSGEIQVPKDAWGLVLMQKVHKDSDRGTYEFLVVSRGPDHKVGSDDDIVLVYTKDFTTGGNKFGDVATDKEKDVARISRKRRKGTVSLSELKKVGQKGRRGKPPTMSLEELAGQAKKKRHSRPKPQVKSLDELMGK